MNLIKKSLVLAIVPVTLTLSACNKSDNNSAQAPTPVPAPKPTPNQPAEVAKIQGDWTSECRQEPATSTMNTLHVENTTYRQTTSTFIGSVCTSSPDAVAVDEGDFTFGNEITAGSGLFELNLVTRRALLTPQTTVGAAALNGIAFCGISNWAAGTQVDVTSQVAAGSCDGAHTNTFLALKVADDSQTMRVTLPSATKDATSAANRPTDLADSLQYSR